MPTVGGKAILPAPITDVRDSSWDWRTSPVPLNMPTANSSYDAEIVVWVRGAEKSDAMTVQWMEPGPYLDGRAIALSFER